jgi:hypothetical protein
MRLIIVLLAWVCVALGAGNNSAITGVWRAHIDAALALVTTISDEGGGLTGAILFHLVRRDDGQPPRSFPEHPEPMFNLKFDGKALDFRVSHRRSHGARTANDPPVKFRMKLTGPNEGLLIRESGENEAIRVTRDK